MQIHKMTDKIDNHCYECAGHAKRKGESCSTCDGEGNLNKVEKKPVEKSSKKA